MDPVTASALTKLAVEHAAPFTKTASERLHSEIFGSGRAARSTDIVIINTTNKKFMLGENICETGGWTGSMLPNHEIPPNKSVIHGAESYGFCTGATECVVKYESIDRKASLELNTSNPYIGPVAGWGRGDGCRISTVVGRGNNNIVRFTISD